MTEVATVYGASEIEDTLRGFLEGDVRNAHISTRDGDVELYVRKSWRMLFAADAEARPSTHTLCFDIGSFIRLSNREAYDPARDSEYFFDDQFMTSFMDVFEKTASRYGMSVYFENVFHMGFIHFLRGRGYEYMFVRDDIASEPRSLFLSSPGSLSIPSSYPVMVEADPDYQAKLMMIHGPLYPLHSDNAG